MKHPQTLPLIRWRDRMGLAPTAVDRLMGWREGRTEEYERNGTMTVPCSDLIRLIQLYRVPVWSFYAMLDDEAARLRRRVPPKR